MVAAPLADVEWLVAPGALNGFGLDPFLSEGLRTGCCGGSTVQIGHGVAFSDQLLQRLAVMHRRGSDRTIVDQLTAAGHLHMVLGAVITLAVLFRRPPVHVLLAGLGEVSPPRRSERRPGPSPLGSALGRRSKTGSNRIQSITASSRASGSPRLLSSSRRMALSKRPRSLGCTFCAHNLGYITTI